MQAYVVIPTYNERDNITELIERILAADPSLHVVVVDDNSPDGTGSLVEQIGATENRVLALRRPGRLGYGTAVADGMRFSLERNADLVLSMDADFSHDPVHLPEILHKMTEYDVMIGSRYVRGGGTRNWGIIRKLLSAGANSVARRLLGIPAKDCTGGYRCYRRNVIEEAGVPDVKVEGYGFLVATLYSCHRNGFRIGEVPITFVDRRYGKSKLSKRIIFEAIGVVLRLWWERLHKSRVPPELRV